MVNRTFKILLLFVCVLIGTSSIKAQELNCKVQVNTQETTGTDKSIYENLQKSVQAYMNSTKFTTLQLKQNERLDCSFLFVISKREGTSLTCDFQVQSSRPVYASNYNTTLLNFREALIFDYQENQTLTFNENSVNDNLTATLDFWAYVIIGLDFDSFSKLGGTPYFQRAQEITTMAQGSLGDNWKSQEDKNHWGWINALTNESQGDMRLLSYQYHRMGLDRMYDNPGIARNAISLTLNNLKSVRQAKPSSPLLSNFIDSKSDEITNIYSLASTKEKNTIYELLSSIYPALSNKLQVLKNKN